MPAILEAIRSAKRSIVLETFILWSDQTGRSVMDALIEQALAGVTVHLIADDAGSQDLRAADISRMRDAGIHVDLFNPLEKILLVFPAAGVNHRTHRKLLIVDGRVGFIGGLGFSDLWLGHDQGGVPWRENVYRVEGPVVAQMQAAFMENWIESVGELLDGDAYFPELFPSGDTPGQIVLSSPRDGDANIELMFLLAINAAEQSIDIGTAYFVPDQPLADALIKADERGVRVRVLVPGSHTDSKLAREASTARWDQLFEAGIEIFEYQPAMYHCKIMIVDGLWTSVGSANLDPRSLRLSDECNLNVFDERFAARQTEMYERDLLQARKITELEHKKRSLGDRIGEFFASLFSPQL
jgi:cardiolipin synthase